MIILILTSIALWIVANGLLNPPKWGTYHDIFLVLLIWGVYNLLVNKLYPGKEKTK